MAETQEVQTPAGAGVAYEVATARLSSQLQDIADLDAKLGVGIAALGVVVAAFVTQKLAPVLEAVFSTWLLIGLIEGLRAFLVGRYEVAPEPRVLAEKYAGQAPDDLKWTALPLSRSHRSLAFPKLG